MVLGNLTPRSARFAPARSAGARVRSSRTLEVQRLPDLVGVVPRRASTVRPIVTIVTLVLSILASSLLAHAQQAAQAYRIGVLLPAPAATIVQHVEALRGRLVELGYTEGQNLVLELRSSGGAEDGLDRLATDLVRAKVDVLVAWTTPECRGGRTPVIWAEADRAVSAGRYLRRQDPQGRQAG